MQGSIFVGIFLGGVFVCGGGEMRLRFCLVKKKKQITNLRNKRLNLSRS